MQTEREKKLTCFHEAAHAVALVRLLSCTPSEVSIVEEPGYSNGHVDVTVERRPENFHKVFAVYFAGAVAANLVSGKPSNISGDLAGMISMSMKWKLSEEEFDKALGAGFEQACVFLNEHFPAIEKLARKLFEKKVMTGEEVLAEIKGCE
jgi:hypothetical protein